MSRQAQIARGRASSTRTYSTVRPKDPSLTATVCETLQLATPPQRRAQILSDSHYCSQFACLWNDVVGILTYPEYATDPSQQNTPIIVGSYSDTIGDVYPVSVGPKLFSSWFTTLVRKDDATQFHLPQHPTAPDTVQGPPPAGPPAAASPVPASNGRLNFTTSGEDGQQPVIAALPCFLPMPPGHTFPVGTQITSSPGTFRDDFPLFEVWLQGLAYAKTHNDAQSVTMGGGPLPPR